MNSEKNDATGAGVSPGIERKDWFRLDLRKFISDGFDICEKTGESLLITVRGMCMIDVFILEDLKHIAFLDFDLSRPAALDSAFASPFIGLPFNAMVRRTVGRVLIPFDDLRKDHHVGFFIERQYRNKGGKGLWNLDEFMMAVAMELAYEQGCRLFVIKPTDDKLNYYRRKYDAQMLYSTGLDRLVGIDIEAARDFVKHIVYERGDDGRILYMSVKCEGD